MNPIYVIQGRVLFDDDDDTVLFIRAPNSALASAAYEAFIASDRDIEDRSDIMQLSIERLDDILDHVIDAEDFV